MVHMASAAHVKRRIAASSSDESGDNQPLSKRSRADVKPSMNGKPLLTSTDVKPTMSAAALLLAAAQAEDSSSSDEDVPIASSCSVKSSPVSIPRTAQTSSDAASVLKNGNHQNGTSTKPVNGNGIASTKRRKSTTVAKAAPLSDSDDEPMVKKKKPLAAPKKKGNPLSDSDDEPMVKKKKPLAPPKKRGKPLSDSDDEPMIKKKKPLQASKKVNPLPDEKVKRPKTKGTGKAVAANGTDSSKPLVKEVTKAKGKRSKVVPKSEGSSDELPISTRPPIKAVKVGTPAMTPAVSPAAKKRKAKKEEEVSADESEDEEYKWWEQQKDDDSKKWDTLQHNGVLFPPPYVPLPSHVKMKYNGKSVKLSPEAEEVAGFFAVMLQTDHVQKPVFRTNFFNDFKDVLEEFPPRDGTVISQFELCNFQPMYDYFELEREKKKQMTKEEKKVIKTIKDELEENYKFCLLDGRKEKVGNFRVEPPSLFRGRGEHPKTGMLKRRIDPEQITINCGEHQIVPEPPAGHAWGKVIHNDKASWLAMWKENINGAFKYVFLAAGSSLKGQSDMKKFEKARLLKHHIDRIRRDYTQELTDKVMATRQRATAMYLIDRFALRAGNEKGEEEADTVGCCSLRYEHVTLAPPRTVTFDFLGKDSIRFHQQVDVDEQVFKNLKIFKKDPKEIGDLLFDRLTTASLNKHLSAYMPGLSAKVFRTYNASWTFEQQLEKTPEDASVADKILAYNRANREVAVLCNHQRSVSKTHHIAMERALDKIRALKYQRRRLRWQLHHSEGYNKKAFKEFNEEESDLDDDWILQHEEELVSKERDRITKKFEKDNVKLEEEQEPMMKASELEERLLVTVEFGEKLKREREAEEVEGRGDAEKVSVAIGKMDDKIAAAKTSATDRDEGKETSLSTSKINYIDPRLTYAWCAKHGVPIEKMFTKTLREKFTWAAETPADFEF